MGLAFKEEADDLSSVLASVTLVRDVDPVGATVGGLFDELVEVAIVHNPREPLVQDVHVGVVLPICVQKVIDRNVDVITNLRMTSRDSLRS